MSSFTHLKKDGTPGMVSVQEKQITFRTAHARGFVTLEEEVLQSLEKEGMQTSKGSIFQTAIIAGTMGVKKTAELIPFCHPIGLEKCKIDVIVNEKRQIQIDCKVGLHAKTGVEMEALTGVSTAALAIYDMCKSFSQNIRMGEFFLVEKKGGKSDYLVD